MARLTDETTEALKGLPPAARDYLIDLIGIVLGETDIPDERADEWRLLRRTIGGQDKHEEQVQSAAAIAKAALQEAIRKAGGVRALSRWLGVAHQAVSAWPRAPALRVLEIERLTEVSRHDLRPDVYPREPRENGRQPPRGKKGPPAK
jgi:DNA-binding transcriptional regulator YdaS (Cro superfamily)